VAARGALRALSGFQITNHRISCNKVSAGRVYCGQILDGACTLGVRRGSC
jgi:hypothetical protein